LVSANAPQARTGSYDFYFDGRKMIFATDHIPYSPDKIAFLVQANLPFLRSTGPPQNI
jgi:hypothetical protein